MCGIAGWFDMAGERPADRTVIRAMTDAIRHRGPDGEGFYFGPGIGLGHRRLAIIDLNTGDQPMFNPRKTICITYNGEIYNYRELRRELQTRGHRFVTASDTEVIIEAYDEWGSDCLSRLQGMFAFAIWDEARRLLFLARDRVGEKPLYYSILPDRTMVFGSELKALLAVPAVRREIDPCAIEEFFALGYVAEPRSIYKAVNKLPAGTCMIIPRGRPAALTHYWDPKPVTEMLSDAAKCADELVDRLGAIVKSELVADVPVGTFLSGGTDSSGITALMATATSEPVSAFTIGFSDSTHDETHFAASVAERYGLRHVVERMCGIEVDSVRGLSRIFDEPFGDSSALPSLHLMRLAREHVTVALSGDGGDELFAGYRRYAFHTREESLRAIIPGYVRRPLFGALARLYPQLDWAPRTLRARHTFREISLDSEVGYFWNVSVVDDDQRNMLFSPRLCAELAGYSALEVIQKHMRAAPSDDPLTRAQYVDIKTWLPGDILTKVDRTAMACSLEVRVPMLDGHFVEWALGLPRALKLSNTGSIIVLKRAFERFVPRGVLYRPKMGFTVPLASWFRGVLGEHLMHELRMPHGLAETGLFNEKAIDALIDAHRRGLSDNSRALWLLWMFQRFLGDVDAASVTPMTAVA
jgi:asparagine synthase (glutamine-hydrolysing)